MTCFCKNAPKHAENRMKYGNKKVFSCLRSHTQGRNTSLNNAHIHPVNNFQLS